MINGNMQATGDEMQKTVRDFIREYDMIKPGDKVLVAVSGGADSVCLMYLLNSMKEQLRMELRIMHVHHGLRGKEADRDAAFVEEEAKRLNLPCRVVYRNVTEYGKEQKLSVEEAGRVLRYQALEKEAMAWGNAKIATAHHREDQAETILHNLFRGSGLKGLCGMSAVKGAVIRPLLCVGRQEILKYLQEQGLSYCEDSTNACQDYTRNRLRHKLIPEICRDINAGAVKHIVGAGKLLSQADEYLEGQAEEIWNRYGKRQKEAGSYGIELKVLENQPDILKGYLIRKMIGLCTNSVKDITFVHIDQICRLAEKGTGKKVSLPYGLEAKAEYGTLWIEFFKTEPKPDGAIEPVCVEKSAEITVKALKLSHFPYKKDEEIPENRYTKWFDYDTIKNTLSVRNRQTGDYITLKGGKRKTVKAYMIDEKIPREERERILLLAEGHHILWIVGYRISEYYKITEHTRQILQVQMDGGDGHGG